MANATAVAGNWNDLKGRIRSKWGQMTDDTLEQAKGSMESLVGAIQRTTGEAKETIQAYLNAGVHEGANLYKQAADAVQVGYKQASDVVQAGAEQVMDGAKVVGDSIKSGAEQTSKLVQARPVESLLFTFAAGMIAGLTVGLVLRSR
ncbi:MAG: CsbD-like protein [Planctomycetaceae bacterium]|nr:CsbD-like protein [Planctomycetaceae bacterium]